MTSAVEPPPSLDRREHGVILDAEHPWPGLVSFVEHNREYFRGRDADVDEVFRLVESSLVTVVYGPSGLGKTSLLQAGVFPRLRETNWLPVPVRLDFDDDTPLVDQVFEAIVREVAGMPERCDDETLWEFFHRRDVVFWNERHRVARPVLVFDQFEELFTIGKEKAAGRAEFLAQLADLTAGRPSGAVISRLASNAEESECFDPSRHRYAVVLSLREDYLAELDVLRALYPAIDAVRKRLTRMNGRDALSVVDAGKHLLDPPTARAIVNFVADGDPDSAKPLEEMEVDPALLSVVAAELNNKRLAAQPPMEKIDRGLLEQNRASILADFYASAMKEFEDRPSVRGLVEDGLLTPNGYRASMSEDQAEAQFGVGGAWIGELVEHRLVRVETRGRARRIELTHDLLTGVIRESRDRRRDVEKQVAERGREEAERRERRVRGRLRLTNIALALVIMAIFAGLCFKYLSEQRKARQASGVWAMRAAFSDINEDRPADALASLAHAMRTDPSNTIARRLTLDLLLSQLWYVVRAVWPYDHGVGLLRFSDDGRRLLIASGGNITVRDLPDGKRKTFPFPAGVTAAGLVPDGNRLITVSARRVTLWDVADAGEVVHWDEDEDVTGFDISPDGSLIAVCAGDFLEVREIGGSWRFRVPIIRNQYSVRFSRDGARIAVANRKAGLVRIEVWETNSGNLLGGQLKAVDPQDRVAFSIDPTLTQLAIVEKLKLTVVPLAGKARILWVPRATSIEFRSDGGALLAVIEGRAHVLLLVDDRGAPTEGLEDKTPFGDRLQSASFSAGGLGVMTRGIGGQLRLWTYEGDPLSAPIGGNDVVMATVSTDGRQVAIADQKSVSLLSTPGLLQLAMPSARWADMSADEQTVYLRSGDVNEVIDASSGHARPNGNFMASNSFVPPEGGAVVLPPSRLADTTWTVLNPATGKRVEMKGLPRGIRAPLRLDFSGNGKYTLLRTKSDQPFAAWVHDIATGALIRHFMRLPGDLKNVTYSALSFDGGRAAFIDSDGDLAVYELGSQWSVSRHTHLNSVDFSRDGKQLITDNGWHMSILDSATLAFSGEVPTRARVTFARFSDDTAAKYIVTASPDGTARVWLRDSLKPVGEPLRHLSAVIGADFSADGHRFVTTTQSENHVRVWDTESGLPLTTPHRILDDWTPITLGAPGRRIAVMDRSGFARVIELPEGTADDAPVLARLAESVAGLRWKDGTVEPNEAPMKITVPGGSTVVARLVEDFQTTGAQRRLTPFTETTLDTFIMERLHAAGENRENVARKLALVYPGAVPALEPRF